MTNTITFDQLKNINESHDTIINIPFDELDYELDYLYNSIEIGLNYNILNYQISFYNLNNNSLEFIKDLFLKVAGLLTFKYDEHINIIIEYGQDLYFKNEKSINKFIDKLNEECYHLDYNINFTSYYINNNDSNKVNNHIKVTYKNINEDLILDDIINDLTLDDEELNSINTSLINTNNNIIKSNQKLHYDVAVIGAGLYGRYIAEQLSNKNLNVIIIAEDDCSNFKQSKSGVASLVNQARIHNGYHYPRSITTAKYSVDFYQKFIDDFNDAVINDFKKIYAIPKYGSQTTAKQFEEFCSNLGVQCDKYMPSILNKKQLQGSWLCDEKAIDTIKMMQKMIERTNHIDLINSKVIQLDKEDNLWSITCENQFLQAAFIANASYAGINTIENLAKVSKTPVKFEACEIALFKAPKALNNLSFTFMDGPFTSLMPYNQDGLWSLTSVLYTPHYASKESIISDMREMNSNFDLMCQQLKLYLNEDIVNQFEYVKSEYVVKTISAAAENDDNRFVQINWQDQFVSILSGKLNAIYELDHLILKIEKAVKLYDK